MSKQPSDSSAQQAAAMKAQVPPPSTTAMDGFEVKSNESASEKLVDAIEMIGEEEAAGFRPPGHSEVTAGMRYLHCSRTIHQLVTDRNRSVGIFLAVASLLVTASSALVNASPQGDLIVPLEHIQRWCMPFTFGTLTVLAVLVAFLLIRTRIGLIYEVAKMNALLGLPSGRVQRVGILSIFFIMQTIVSLAGGCSAGLFSVFMLHLADPESNAVWPAFLIGALVTGLLLALYVVTVLHTTSDRRLQQVGK
jgi:hypothetical protein